MTNNKENERFVAELTAAQPRLYAYIFSLLGNRSHADEVLQETNLVLWRKSDEFDPDTNFAGWACKVAQFQVLAFRRDQGREVALFNTELVDQLAADLRSRQAGFDQRRIALQDCLEKLPTRSRQLISRRYTDGASLQEIAKSIGRTADSLATTFHRIRIALRDCIRSQESLSQG